MAHVKTISDATLLKIAKDIDMVPELCFFKEEEGKQTWEPWRIRAIVSKLDDMGLVKRPAVEVYFQQLVGGVLQQIRKHLNPVSLVRKQHMSIVVLLVMNLQIQKIRSLL